MKDKMIETTKRISHMESLFDTVLGAVNGTSETVGTNEVKAAVAALSNYMTSGEWPEDYELDEAGLLPPQLKRGVLSQDGLYDLLQKSADLL